MADKTTASIARALLALSLAAILLALSACGRQDRTQPAASRGVLDLTGWDFAKDGPVDLNGYWAFYWKKFIPPLEAVSENRQRQSGFVKVPGGWNDFVADGKNIGDDGYATYRLTVITGPREERLGLKFGDIESSYDVFVNGSLISSVGTVGASKDAERPDQKIHVVGFTHAGGRADIVLHVSNYYFIQSGILRSIMLGRESDLISCREKKLLLEFIFIGILIIMGLYHFSIFFLRRDEKLPLYFGLVCIVLAIRILNKGERFILTMFPDFGYLPWASFNYTVDYIVGIFFVMFFYELFRGAVSKKIICSIQIFFILLIAGAIIPPFKIEALLGETVANVPAIFALLYGLCISFKLVIRKRPGSLLYLTGILAIFVFQILELLYGMMIIQIEFRQYHGMMIFIVIQAFAIAKGYSDAYNENLALKNGLELNVKERTAELQIERNKLHDRNKTMEREIALARETQHKLIPNGNPAAFISSIYRPMDEIGGDFYDFIRFEDSNKIGIFLSDVSGHGVPVAFFTSMIKTLLLQAGKRSTDPAALFLYMNEVLQNQTANNYVTAFYGIYDPENRTLLYSNAGHNQPYVIDQGRVVQLQGGKNTALAIFPNNILAEAHKVFENREYRFQPGCKLLLYTDGLVETRPVDGHILFENTRLEQVLAENHRKPGDEFLAELIKELLIYRKTEYFEDDICMICVDIL